MSNNLETERRSERIVPVYFAMRTDDLGEVVRVGKGPRSRWSQWVQNGYTMVAFMPGGEPVEGAIHRAFERHRRSYGKSHYDATAIFPYVEALLKKGLATDRYEDVEHVPVVPLDTVMPDSVLTGSDAENEKNLSLFDLPFMPKNLPTTQERIAKAASYYLHSSKSDEWYTPIEIIEAARATLGEIDLDPASCWKANRRIKARYYYSETVSGLAAPKPWQGRVWMNPPYGAIGPRFAKRLAKEYQDGNVTAACALFSLTHMSALWFSSLHDICSAIGITRGRLEFDVGRDDQIDTGNQPVSGHVLVYLGRNPDAFAKAFGSLCTIYLKPSER